MDALETRGRQLLLWDGGKTQQVLKPKLQSEIHVDIFTTGAELFAFTIREIIENGCFPLSLHLKHYSAINEFSFFF